MKQVGGLVCVLVLFAAQAVAKQSLITSSGNNLRTAIFPPSTPRTELRAEFRLRVARCSPGVNSWQAASANIINIPGAFGIGCRHEGETTLGISNGSGTVVDRDIQYAFRPDTEYIFLIQRTVAVVEARWWTTDGQPAGSFSVGSHGSGAFRVSSGLNNIIGGRPGFHIAWLRLYSTNVDLPNTAMPRNTVRQPADLGHWDFDGDLTDSSGLGQNMTPVPGNSECAGSRCWADSPVYPPVLQFSIRNALAGRTMQLDATSSFAYDDADSVSDFTWEQLNGPVRVMFSDRHAAVTSVLGQTAGTYTFQLTARSADGPPVSTSRTVLVRNINVTGQPVLPSNVLTGTSWVTFQLDSVPGAARVRVTVRKPDGRTLPPVTCTSSPCAVAVDNRQSDHTFFLEYLSEGGEVLRKSDEQQLSVEQASSVTTPALWIQPYIKLWVLSLWEMKSQKRVEDSGRFLADKTNRTGGGDMLLAPLNPAMRQPVYSDTAGSTPVGWYIVRSVADRHGYTMEDLFLHFTADYNTAGGFVWAGMDKFDAAEPVASGHANGVLLVSGDSVTADVTNSIYDNSAPHVRVEDKLMIGYSMPFDEMNFILSTPASAPVAWEYWNGRAWNPLVVRSDTTDTGGQSLARNGQILFTPPSDWTLSVQPGAGTNRKYWVRMVAARGSGPVIAKLSGDTWMTNGKLRGWRPDPELLVNRGAGELEYNPEPSAGATARFRHQARLQGIWANNTAMYNIANIQNGERTVPRIVVDSVAPKLQQGWNGVWVDNAFPLPTLSGWNANNAADLASQSRFSPEMAGKDWAAEAEQSYIEIGKYLRSEYGEDRVLCANNTMWQIVRHGNCFFDESFKMTWTSPQPYGAFSQNWPASSVRSANPAQVKPGPQNPNNTEAHIEVYDNRARQGFTGGHWLVWDRGNRGPMTALTSYLIYSNPNTYLMYHTGTNFLYYQLDEFWEIAESPEWTTGASIAASAANGAVIGTNVSVTAANGSGTMVFPAPHGLKVGDWVYIAGLNAYYEVTEAASTTSAVIAGIPTGSYTGRTVQRAVTVTGSFGSMPLGSTYVRMGDNGEFISWSRLSSERIATLEPIGTAVPSGTPMYRISKKLLPYDAVPPVERVAGWGQMFPAMFIDIGVPDASGLNGGEGVPAWRTAGASGTNAGIQRRDFTRAIVLYADSGSYAEQAGTASVANGSDLVTFTNSAAWWTAYTGRRIRFGTVNSVDYPWYTYTYVNPTTGRLDRPYEGATATGQRFSIYNYHRLDEYGNEIVFADSGMPSVLYPLRADGLTSNAQCEEARRTPDGGCTAIRLRSAEGVVLMKEPVW